MRHQFYADRNDVEKWTLLLRLAKEHGASIFWGVMLTSDVGNTHGGNWSSVAGADPAVVAFFDEERRRISAGEPRDLTRVALLAEACGLPLRLFPDIYPGGESAQNKYVRELLVDLAEVTGRRVVFLDPDNGLAGKNATDAHVRPEHLQEVWDALRTGDVLVLYQHGYRVADWPEVKRTQVAEVLQAAVAVAGTGPVRFIHATR
ncbi:MAG TPA: hypothetical protein VGP72_31975 [Planctomycetota bacterium]|jgi:hypothetical protein